MIAVSLTVFCLVAPLWIYSERIRICQAESDPYEE